MTFLRQIGRNVVKNGGRMSENVGKVSGNCDIIK